MSIAAIRVGAQILEFRRDTISGFYNQAYISAVCPTPNAGKEGFKKWEEEMKAKEEKEFKALRPLADADSSGFVSTSEGHEFQTLALFGYEAAFALETEQHHLQRACEWMHMSLAEFEEALSKYRLLQSRVKRAGLAALPEVNP